MAAPEASSLGVIMPYIAVNMLVIAVTNWIQGYASPAPPPSSPQHMRAAAHYAHAGPGLGCGRVELPPVVPCEAPSSPAWTQPALGCI